VTAIAAEPEAGPRSPSRIRASNQLWSRALTAGRWPLYEAAVALAAAGWMLLSTKTIKVFAPLDRVSQVSGLAALQFRFLVPALALVAFLLLARRSQKYRDLASRTVFAALPGFISGFLAAGVTLALRGVSLPLNGTAGDAGDMERWAIMLQHGQMTHPGYPPLYPRFVWFMAELNNHNVFVGLKQAEILTTAILGPAAYLAWRFVVSRPWACVLALVFVPTLAEPYKAYEPLVLAIIVPIVIAYLRFLQTSPKKGLVHLALAGLGWGLLVGEIFILFAGPFYWAAFGVGLGTAVMFPWRTGPRHGLTLLGATVVGFLIPSYHLVDGLLHEAPDPYFFFGTSQDPAYTFVYLTDMPGNAIRNGTWPPTGELGGVGVFGVIVLILTGVAIWLGMRRTPVLLTAGLLTGGWVMRFYLASHEYRDQLVRYWPRTTTFSLYCFLILSVFAVKLIAERVTEFVAKQRELTAAVQGKTAVAAADAEAETEAGTASAADEPEASEDAETGTAKIPAPRRGLSLGTGTGRKPAPFQTGMVGLAFALTLFAGMSASAATDKIMPKNDGSEGQLAWTAQHDSPHNLKQGITLVNGKP
jgi:galactan 5-O-arabinofuranosyltransferase